MSGDTRTERYAGIRGRTGHDRKTFGFGLPEFPKLLCAKPAELVAMYGLGQSAGETRPRLRLIRSNDKAATS